LKQPNPYIYGFRSTVEAIQSGKSIEKIFLKKGLRQNLFNELYNLIKYYQIPYQFVPAVKLQKMAGQKTHQGVIAMVSSVQYQKLEYLLPQLFEQGEVPFFLVLDGITDVRNFGAIARTAEGAGVNAIIVPSKGAAQIGPDAVKTSSGALEYLPVCRTPHLLNTIRFLKESGLQMISTTDQASKTIYDTDFTVPVAIVMGNEEKGVSTEVLNSSDMLIKIPMTGNIQSLNVSVASAVVLYEVVRQRNDF
jgi:23S rRNA (guanosine2251-2'-O)-methyltransferase